MRGSEVHGRQAHHVALFSHSSSSSSCCSFAAAAAPGSSSGGRSAVSRSASACASAQWPSVFVVCYKFVQAVPQIYAQHIQNLGACRGRLGQGCSQDAIPATATRGPQPAAGLRLPPSRSPPPASKCAFYFQPRRLHRSSLPHSEPPDCLTTLISRCAYACCAGPRPTPQSCRAGGQAGGQARQGTAGWRYLKVAGGWEQSGRRHCERSAELISTAQVLNTSRQPCWRSLTCSSDLAGAPNPPHRTSGGCRGAGVQGVSRVCRAGRPG